MIGSIRGKLCEVLPDCIVVETGGVGFEVMASSAVLGSLPPIGEEVFLYTTLDVKEDSLKLFGFKNREEKRLFSELVKVNGIGAKSAMALISCVGCEALCEAIVNNDSKTIAKAPGVGTKTAMKIVVELSDRIGKALPKGETKGKELVFDGAEDAILALAALGFDEKKCAKVVAEAIKEGVPNRTEDLVKDALKRIKS